MTEIHIEKAKDGREIHFEMFKLFTKEEPADAIPRFCTYCGSNKLSEDGYLSSYDDGIMCENCGMQIHDCCTTHSYDDFKQFMEEHKDGILEG